jgi:hypothetical protein
MTSLRGAAPEASGANTRRVTRPASPALTKPSRVGGSFGTARAERNLFARTVALAAATAVATPEQCRAWMESCGDEDPEAVCAAARRWAVVDPSGLLAWLQGPRVSLTVRRTAARELFAEWTKTDPAAAVTAVGSGKNPVLREEFFGTLLSAMFYHDPDRARELAAGTGNRAWVHLDGQFSGWVDGRFGDAAEWILAMPRGNFRMGNALNLAQRWGLTDPAAALGFAWNLGPVYFEKTSEIVLARWLASDPAGAADYLAGDALPFVRARLAPVAAARMAEENPNDAAAWVNEHLSGRARVEGLRSVVRAGAQHAPLESALIAESLPDGPVKHEALRDAAEAWYSKDMASAAPWAQTLPPGYRSAITEGITRAKLSAEQRAQALSLLTPPAADAGAK